MCVVFNNITIITVQFAMNFKEEKKNHLHRLNLQIMMHCIIFPVLNFVEFLVIFMSCLFCFFNLVCSDFIFTCPVQCL